MPTTMMLDLDCGEEYRPQTGKSEIAKAIYRSMAEKFGLEQVLYIVPTQDAASEMDRLFSIAAFPWNSKTILERLHRRILILEGIDRFGMRDEGHPLLLAKQSQAAFHGPCQIIYSR